MSEMLHSAYGEENDERAATPGDNPAGAAGSGDEIVRFDRQPTDTLEYATPARPGLRSEIGVNFDYWLPEDNENNQHVGGGDYTPPAEGIPLNKFGAGIYVSLTPVPLRPGMPVSSNDGYLTSIKILGPDYEGEAPGSFYACGTVNGEECVKELTSGTVVEDFAGNRYTAFRDEKSFVLTIDSSSSSWKPVDLSQIGLVYRGKEDSDEDLVLSYVINAGNDTGGTKETKSGVGFYFGIDAVADKPGYEGGATEDVIVGPEDGGDLAASEVVYENGAARRTISGGTSSADGNAVFFSLGVVTFSDYVDVPRSDPEGTGDGVERHFLLLAAEDPALDWAIDWERLAADSEGMFLTPESGEPETIWLGADNAPAAEGAPGAREFVRIEVSNAWLAEHGGRIEPRLPILLPEGMENGEYIFDARAGAEENPVNSVADMEFDFNNNFSVTDIDAVRLNVRTIETTVTITTGWAYEGGAAAGGASNPDADPEGTGMAAGEATQTFQGAPRSAAPVRLTFNMGEDESVGQWITLSYDANLGDLYFQGARVSSVSGGRAFATLPSDRIEDGSLLAWFVPNPEAGADADFSLRYEFTITKGTGDNAASFNAAGEMPIVLDAVAEPAAMELAPGAQAPDFDGFTLEYAVPVGADAAETRYIVVANPEGLLALGDLGELSACLSPATAAELRAFENPDPAVGRHFDNLGPDDIILRMDDPGALDALDGAADGTINLRLPLVVTDRAAAGERLDATVSTVVVEGGGNNPANWEQTADKEYDFANNIAVTEETVVVHLAGGDASVTVAGGVHEGDQPGWHVGDPTPEYGAPIHIALSDPFEAARELSFSLTSADGSPAGGGVAFGAGGEYTLVPEGGSLRFTAVAGAESALYTGVEILDAGGAVIATRAISPASTLEDLAAAGGASGLRFIPSGDNDADVVIGMNARIMDVRSGDVVSVTDIPPATVVRDAVADKPAAESSVTPEGGHEATAAGATLTVDITAAFGDGADGSEAHYLFVSREYLASVAVPGALAASCVALDAAAANAVCEKIDGPGGIPGATADDYFVIRVNAGGDGRITLPLEATLRADISGDGDARIDVKAVAVEHDGFLTGPDVGANGDAEPDAANNVSVTDAPAAFAWATLENAFAITARTPAWEDDQPGQNAGSAASAGGAIIDVAPGDPSEVFDTLTVSWATEDGRPASGALVLSAGGDSLRIPSGATLVFSYDPASPARCTSVSYTDAGGVHTLAVPGLTLAELSGQGLRYVPDAGGDSDADVEIVFSGATRETASGETGVYGPHTVQVVVDAVADRPAGEPSVYDYGTDADGRPLSALPEGAPVSFGVNAVFSDWADGSEAHYLFVNTRYLADGSLQLLDEGRPFAGGARVTGEALRGLLERLDGESGLIPGADDVYEVWELDADYLAAREGRVALTVQGALKSAGELASAGPEKTPLNLEVKAVAVERDGFLTPEAETPGDGNDEADAGNNAAVTEVGTQVQWDAFRGVFELRAETAWEGDQPGRHAGDAATAGGAALVVAPEDAGETFTRMTLDYDDSRGVVSLSVGEGRPPLELAPGAELTFAFDPARPARIVSLTCGETTLEVPGLTLEELTSGGLRYVPRAGDDGDADATVKITADTLDTATGVTGECSLTGVVVVDAVADRPEDVAAAQVVAAGENPVIVVNEEKGAGSVEIALRATFGDYADGSEGHYFFISDQYLAALEGLPEGASLLDAAEAARVAANAGLSGGYFVLRVDDAWLREHDGVADFTLAARLDGAVLPDEEELLHLDIRAGAVEHQGVETPADGADLGGGSGRDADAGNNVSLVDAGIDLRYARLDNAFDVVADAAHEGDAPGQHAGSLLPEGGAVVDFAPSDASEVLDTLTVAYDDGEGSLYLDLPTLEQGNVRLELPDGAELSFTYRNEGAGASECAGLAVVMPDGAATSYTLTGRLSLRELMSDGRLRYVPDAGSQSDADVTAVFSGASRETATGERGEFSHEITIRVDAVADRPDAASEAANKDSGRAALEPGAAFDVDIHADFGDDLQDGSERHYLFVSKAWLADLRIPAALGGAVSLLDAASAATICARVDGPDGIPGASAEDYFVLSVEDGWLRDHGGALDARLEGVLKDAAALESAGGAEGGRLKLEIRAASVEHQGFQTPTGTDLGDGYGQETDATNNVAVSDASAAFVWAAASGEVAAEAGPAWEGDQPGQHRGDYAVAGGAAITLAPEDAGEVFTDLTLNYDDGRGVLTLAAPDGTRVALRDGARIEFVCDPERPTLCVSARVWQPGETGPSATLSFTDAGGAGMSFAELTSACLRYAPRAGDNGDADATISYSGTALETTSGAESPFEGELTVTVDAVADMPGGAAGEAVVLAADGARPGARPGETVTISLRAAFEDYDDGSEAHYVFIAREHLPHLSGVPAGVEEITDPSELARIFASIAGGDGEGIHAGAGAAAEYHVLRAGAGYLRANNGQFSMSMTVAAGAEGVYPVEAAAVSVEYDGRLTDADNPDGGGANREASTENNVAEADMSFAIVVREFSPGKVSASLESEWVYENDRSEGDETWHGPDDDGDRDRGAVISFSGQGEGNVISSVTFEYAMPSNGAAEPHRIQSFNPDGSVNTDATVSMDLAGKPGTVVVTVTAGNPWAGVGELRFIPGDNYDNADVDITVVNVEVADPFLHQTTEDDPGWGSGVSPDGATLHVRVDAVAQAPELGDFAVSHDRDNPVVAGEDIRIAGRVSFEDTADGSEEHFLLLEIQDGYYPESVTLTFDGASVDIPIVHYSADPAREANYTLQQLVAADDGRPHLFVKLPVDAALAELAGGRQLERMDGISLDATYQTREWAAEGASLRFAAIAAEDVESVREYDADWNIVNDELPFDKRLEQYVPGLAVTDNNTAVTVAAQAAYVYWDETGGDAVNFRGWVFENDRPADHQRETIYILNREDPQTDIVHSWPLAPELSPADAETGRDYGTGMELEIPEHTREISITQRGGAGQGDFYFLPETVWRAYASRSPAPEADTALARYRVDPGGEPARASEGGEYMLVFIPSNEPLDAAAHDEAGAAHGDGDVRFDYELLVDQYGPNNELRGQKKFLGENMVVRVDAVANQAENLEANAPGVDPFSLWDIPGATSSFELSVDFHDLDATEDHYVLVEMPPNFAFRCGDYLYQPGAVGSVSPQDQDAFYTHVMTDAEGRQSFIRYYKIPVDMADIDPVTGRAAVTVEFLRQPGMPLSADYPSSQNLTYGALTEDKTSSRWDSYNPADPNFINRKGADGEYTFDNNTSVIIRNGIGNGADDDGNSPGWPGVEVTPGGSGGAGGGVIIDWGGGGGGSGGSGGTGGGAGGSGPGGNWSGGYWPGFGGGDEEEGSGSGGSGGRLDEFWNPSGPGGGGQWWEEQGGGSGGGSGSSSIEEWIPGGGGGWTDLPDDGHGGYLPDGSDNPWIASRGEGLALEWVFENSTPFGNTEAGQYNAVMPTQIFLTGERPDAACLKIFIPDGEANHLITWDGNLSSWRLEDATIYPRATLILKGDQAMPIPVERVEGGFEYAIPTPGGQLPGGQELFMMLAPDSMGEDFQIGVSWEDAEGRLLSSGNVDVMVDAVAQWANFQFSEEEGVYGVTGEEPSTLVHTEVEIAFLDQDGSESNFLLLEKIPGVLPLHADGNGGYEAPEEVYLEGRTYYRITPSETELQSGKVQLEISVNEELLSPMYIENDIEHDGQIFTGVRLNVGALTQEGQTGVPAIGGEPANWEYTLKNNTALNLQDDALTIVISRAEGEGGDNAIMAKEGPAPEDNLVWLDPGNPESALRLTMDGNDILTSLMFTEASGNGEFLYRDADGLLRPVPLNEDMTRAYQEGRICHRQNRYDDSDARLSWTATVTDGLTGDADTVSGTLSVAVDAVADADEIHLGFPSLDRDAGTLTQTLRFDDHEGNEQHYAVIAPDIYRVIGKRAQALDGDGQWHTLDVETILDPDGKPYYAVRLDGLLDADGATTVRFELHELNVPGIENFPVISGGVSMEPNAGGEAGDREMDLSDNWAVNTKAEFVGQGVVSTENIALVVDAIEEDDVEGAPIVLSGELAENDALVSAVLTFSPREGEPLAGVPGDQIATIVYGGRCFAVTLDDAGAASAAVDFGAGFDPAADFRILWGAARMENGVLEVLELNHAADGTLNLNADFTLRNRLTGQTGTVSGADPDGVPLVPAADAAKGVSGVATAVNGQPAEPAAPVGAAADSVTVVVSGAFADTDGSERHYLLLEVPEGWQASAPGGEYEVLEGVRYYRMSVDGAEAAPSVEVTLVSPDGLNGETRLATAARSVESDGGVAFVRGEDVVLNMSDVASSGLSVALEPVLEDGLLPLADMALARLVGNDGNDRLLSVVFTDLKGGAIVRADGTPAEEPSFTAEQLASGAWFYRPASDYAGELDEDGRPLPVELTYNAVLGETNTGATASLEGLTLAVAVTPVADRPENAGGVSGTPELGDVQTGHKAAISVTLEATFGDTDGSEEHFFVLGGPRGVAVKPGEGYTVNLLSPEETAALGLPAGFPQDAPLYKVALRDGASASVSLDVNLEATTTVYNGGDLFVVGASSELRADGSRHYACSDAGALTLPPPIGQEIGNNAPVAEESAARLDSLRAAVVEGAVAMNIDPDGDAVTPGGLRFGETPGARGVVDGRDCYTVRGEYGTLHLFDDGTYRYALDPERRGAVGDEVFEYTMKDAWGGEGASRIVVSLSAENTAPEAEAVTARLDSVRETSVAGSLVFRDAEGDAVSVAGVDGSGGLVNLGTAEEPRWGFRTAGEYGALEVWEDGGEWRYAYTLNAGARGETRDESFALTLRDALGMEARASLAVDLFNENRNPTAENVRVGLDTLRDADGAVSGALSVSDADGDAVTLIAAAGYDGAAGDWVTDDGGRPALAAAGRYGTLYLYQDGANLSYRYVLTNRPEGGAAAEESFVYTVDDGNLGATSASIVVDLSNANGAPEILGDLNAELDTLRDAGRVVEGALVFRDPDFNADQGRADRVTLAGLEYNGASGAADGSGGFTVNGAYGVFHIDASGAYTYTLSPGHAGAVGEESFTVAVADEFGATRRETVDISLLVRNQNPVASSGAVDLNTLRGGGRASGQVTLTDADGDAVTVSGLSGLGQGVWDVDPEGNPAFVALGRYGLLYLRENGAYSYVLNDAARGESGIDEFAFSVKDGFGGAASGSIRVNLDAANAAPTIGGEVSASIGGAIDRYEDEIVRESGRIVWSDADGDAIGFVSVGGASLPVSGTVEVEGRYGTLALTTNGGNEASWVYSLNPGLDAEGITDTDTFGIVIRDIYGGETAGELSVHLAPLSHAPECDDVNFNWPRTPSGTPVSFLEGNLSFRDTDMAYNPDERLTLNVNGTDVVDAAVVAGRYGSLTIAPDGAFTYTTERIGEDLLEDFVCTVTDAAGNTARGRLYIRLSDNAPVFPNTGNTEEGVFSTENGEESFSALFSLMNMADTAFDAGLPDVSVMAAAPAEPVEIALASVPLPYDTDATQQLGN